MASEVKPVLVAGRWQASAGSKTFHATNPRTTEPIPENYPVSPWSEIEAATEASTQAFDALRSYSPDQIAAFLDRYAERIETRREEIVAMAVAETALPAEPRLNSVELPRTTNQLRQAAAAARDGSWAHLTIDSEANIRSMLIPLGPVCVFGPNNFPMAFNSVAGGDFAAAMAAGNPVIAKANSSHPGTTRLLAEEALAAVEETKMPAGLVQLLYRTDHQDGERLVSDPRVGATGYTGSRSAGLALKAAADRAGKPIYLELSSINPVLVLPGVLRERAEELADELLTSCLMGTGQFCTSPGLILLLEADETNRFVDLVRQRFSAAPVGTLLGQGVQRALGESIEALGAAGAEVITGGKPGGGEGFSYQNTVLTTTGAKFLKDPEAFEREAFGNAILLVTARDVDEFKLVVAALEGNLTGCVYSAKDNSDDAVYDAVVPVLRQRVGRLLNDKMPTGVAVSTAMNHGGPYPATGHAGFTAVGIPASLRRFGMLACYDNIRSPRLPVALRDKNPTGTLWRFIDGSWTTEDA